VQAGNLYWRGRISTLDPIVLTGSDQLLLILKVLYEKQAFLMRRTTALSLPLQKSSSVQALSEWWSLCTSFMHNQIKIFNRFKSVCITTLVCLFWIFMGLNVDNIKCFKKNIELFRTFPLKRCLWKTQIKLQEWCYFQMVLHYLIISFTNHRVFDWIFWHYNINRTNIISPHSRCYS